jgi:hypothetical protein
MDVCSASDKIQHLVYGQTMQRKIEQPEVAMSASLEVRNVSVGISNHIEFAANRRAVQALAFGLLQDLLNDPAAQSFHVQIQRMGVPPPPGGTVQINQGDDAKITFHRFPQ